LVENVLLLDFEIVDALLHFLEARAGWGRGCRYRRVGLDCKVRLTDLRLLVDVSAETRLLWLCC
jgi:hypothetical protein